MTTQGTLVVAEARARGAELVVHAGREVNPLTLTGRWPLQPVANDA